MPAGRPEIVRVAAECPAVEAIAAAADALRRGELVVLPTDTVYGLAASPDVPGAVERLVAAKRRDPERPIPLLAASYEQVRKRGAVFSRRARHLAGRFWPGPLTLVLPVGTAREGFRVPNHAVTLAVLGATGGVLRVTSANRSGEPPARDAASAAAALAEHVSLVLDAGPAPGGEPSSVVAAEGDDVHILREGALPRGRILARPLALFVCTGNMCRSPMAEALCRQWIGPDSGWDMASAGLSALAGLSASDEAIEVMREKGLDLSAHVSQPLTPQGVQTASVLIVMTRAQRTAVVEEYPEAAGKTFLLRAFGPPGSDPDVQDPVGATVDVYRRVRDDIDAVMPDVVLYLRDWPESRAAPDSGLQ
jgi:tRNA threonylcarbamoyl adenosine modification protein (Sua5/YciO/YrdC/YwlC family)